MKVLRRLEGTQTIVEAKNGSIWLCKRVKRKKVHRQKVKKRSVIHMPIQLLWWPNRQYDQKRFELFYEYMVNDEMENYPTPQNIIEMLNKVDKRYLEHI